MEGMLPVLKEAIVSGVVATATRRGPRKKLAGMAVMVFAGLVLFLAIVFIALANYEWLSAQYSSPVAYLVIGLTLLLLSAITFFLARASLHSHERNIDEHSREEISRLVDLLAEELSGELAEPVRNNPKTSLAAAAVAGFLAGDRLH